MSTNTDTKADPAAEVAAASEPRLAEQETKLATNPQHGESTAETSTTEAATSTAQVSLQLPLRIVDFLSSWNISYWLSQSVVEQASNAATAAASTVTAAASTAASTVQDNVFAMFGGGAKKEKKEDEDEDRGDVSGSAKSQREAAAAENPEVWLNDRGKCEL